jgi:hypothetical protein
VLGKVTCTLPANGSVVRCLAHFSDPAAKANVTYAIKATLQDSGAITWTAGAASCSSATTGKKLVC